MHRVLLIDELLRTVLAHLRADSPSPGAEFVRLATVCRAWQDPVLDLLWETLPSTGPLLALLPTLSHEAGTYVLNADPAPSELARFGAYAARIRHIQHTARASPTLPADVLASLAPELLLPALSTVSLRLADPARRPLAPKLFLSHHLRELSIDVGFARRAPDAGAYVEAVAELAPRLESLKLRGLVGGAVLAAAGRLRCLTELALCVGADITPEAMAAAASLPHLQTLRVQLDALEPDALSAALEETGTTFAQLEKLDARGSPDVLAALLGALPAHARLSSARLESDLALRAADEWLPALALLADRAHGALRELSLQSLTSFVDAPAPLLAPRLAFTLSTLQPLSRLRNLASFFLDASVPADMSDADLAALAKWWPSIESLALWSRPADAFDYPTYFTMQPRATPAALRVFADACGALRRLAVPMDVSAVPAPPTPTPIPEREEGQGEQGKREGRGQEVLEDLTIGCARKAGGEGAADARELAACLYRAFPRVRRIEFDCGADGAGEESGGAWPDVRDAYARLQAGA